MERSKLGARPRICSAASIGVLIVAVVVSILAAVPSFAAQRINERALPKGMTVLQAQAAATKAKTRIASEIAKRDTQRNLQMDAALREVAPLRKSMEDFARSDAEYGKFVDGARRIMGDKTLKSQSQALNQHYSRGAQGAAERGLKAGGGAAKYEGALSRILKAASQGLLIFFGIDSYAERPNATIADEVRFTAPYAVHDTDTSRGGPGFTTVNTSVANDDAKVELSAEATSVGLFTGCSGSALVGVFIDVPAGKTHMNVHIYYDYAYKAGVWAALGAGNARLGGLILLTDFQTDVQVNSDQLEFESVFAVVSWYAETTNDETSFLTLPTNVTPGKRYLLTFGIDVGATGIGGGGGGSFVTLTPSAIEVEFTD